MVAYRLDLLLIVFEPREFEAVIERLEITVRWRRLGAFLPLKSLPWMATELGFLPEGGRIALQMRKLQPFAVSPKRGTQVHGRAAVAMHFPIECRLSGNR